MTIRKPFLSIDDVLRDLDDLQNQEVVDLFEPEHDKGGEICMSSERRDDADDTMGFSNSDPENQASVEAFSDSWESRTASNRGKFVNRFLPLVEQAFDDITPVIVERFLNENDSGLDGELVEMILKELVKEIRDNRDVASLVFDEVIKSQREGNVIRIDARPLSLRTDEELLDLTRDSISSIALAKMADMFKN